MTTLRYAGLFSFAGAVFLLGCASGKTTPTNSPDAGETGGPADMWGSHDAGSGGEFVSQPDAGPGTDGDGGCIPQTCSALGYQCGDADDGCGATLHCGECGAESTCEDDHQCSCGADSYEPNEVKEDAHSSAMTLTDDPFTSLSVTATLNSRSDQDWFVYDIHDACCAGNPNVTVRVLPLTGATRDDYQLSAYYVCNSGEDESECVAGAADRSLGSGCIATPEMPYVQLDARCGGTIDDDGKLYVHVSANSSIMCASYNVTVQVN